MEPQAILIIPSAGSGSRMGAPVPKQYLSVAGRTVLEHTVAMFDAMEEIGRIVVAVSPGDGQAGKLSLGRARVLFTGGQTRARTVLNTLQAIGQQVAPETLVLVHDAARPLVRREDVRRLIDETRRVLRDRSACGAVLAVPVPDTVKRTDANGFLGESVDRAGLVRIQTPQCFPFKALVSALSDHPDVTDESSAILAAGERVLAVAGSSSNFKLTHPQDMKELQERLSRNEIRIGTGYDSHRLVEGRPLIIGGVRLEHPLGLDGHSDADVLTHALIDAMLGACGDGNIGMLFPDRDPAYKNADSIVLLRRAWSLIKEQGWSIVNIDSTLIAEAPRISPHVPAMKETLARALGIESDQINIKPKTNERLGFEGRREGISAQVSLLLRR